MSIIVNGILAAVGLTIVGVVIVAPLSGPINDDDEAQRQVDFCGIVIVGEDFHDAENNRG